MQLQVALDVLDLPSALTLANQVSEHVDILELGTPLVKSVGIGAVSAIKAAHPDKLVFADLKTADAGELEATLAFEAGADLITVMGAADDDTVRGAVSAGSRRRCSGRSHCHMRLPGAERRRSRPLRSSSRSAATTSTTPTAARSAMPSAGMRARPSRPWPMPPTIAPAST